MSALPPPAPQKDIPSTAIDASAPITVSSAYFVTGAIFTLVFVIIFHVGAGYLSYQKYGSIGWAILDFFFAAFYYPFYAFFLNTPAAPSYPMMGGMMKGLSRMLAGKRK